MAGSTVAAEPGVLLSGLTGPTKVLVAMALLLGISIVAGALLGLVRKGEVPRLRRTGLGIWLAIGVGLVLLPGIADMVTAHPFATEYVAVDTAF